MLASYKAGLVSRIVDDLKLNGVTDPWVRACVEPHVETVLQEIQHRIAQDIAAPLIHLARQLDPLSGRIPGDL